MTQDAITHTPELTVVRRGRANLRSACQHLESTLAAPLGGRAEQWAADARGAVEGVRAAWQSHVSLTETDEGLFAQIRSDAPHLEPGLRRLHGEHLDLATKLDAAYAILGAADQEGLERARGQLTQVLALLSRHRQRGADLLYQAYQVDIGGG